MSATNRWLLLSNRLESFVLRVSSALAWILVMALVVVAGIDVLGRQIFHASGDTINLIMAALFLNMAVLFIGSAYLRDAHVRIDMMHGKMSARWIAWVELVGNLAVILPVCMLIIIYGCSQSIAAFHQGERVAGGGDLPLMWFFEASIPLGFFLLLAADLSVAIRNVLFLRGKNPTPAPAAREMAQ